MLTFMLDTGATNIFLSVDDCEKLGGLYKKIGKVEKVCLADGKQLSVFGTASLKCDFGQFQCMLDFEVVNAKIPAILGMTFFNQVNPVVNWRRKLFTLKKGSRVLRVPLIVYNKNLGSSSISKSGFQ